MLRSIHRIYLELRVMVNQLQMLIFRTWRSKRAMRQDQAAGMKFSIKLSNPLKDTNQFVGRETRFAPPDDQVQYEIVEIKQEF